MRINDKFLVELGITRESLVQVRDNVLVRLYPADLPIMLNMLDESTLHGTEATCETRWHLSDTDAVSWLRFRCRRVARSMDCYALFLSVENITARKASELALIEQITAGRITDVQPEKKQSLPNRAVYQFDLRTGKMEMPKKSAERFQLPALLQNLPESLAESGIASQKSMPELRKMFADIAAGVSKKRYAVQMSNFDGSYVCDWCDCHLIMEGGNPVGATLTLNASVDQGGPEKL